MRNRSVRSQFTQHVRKASAVIAAAVLAAGALSLGAPSTAHAATPNCTTNPVSPYRISNTVYGVASVSCTTTVNEIRITTSLSRNGGPTVNVTQTCYNASSCSATATAAYQSGTWSTTGMGYAYNGLTWTSNRSAAPVGL